MPKATQETGHKPDDTWWLYLTPDEQIRIMGDLLSVYFEGHFEVHMNRSKNGSVDIHPLYYTHFSAATARVVGLWMAGVSVSELLSCSPRFPSHVQSLDPSGVVPRSGVFYRIYLPIYTS